MKLIKPAKSIQEMVTIAHHKTRNLSQWFFDSKPELLFEEQWLGRVTLTSCLIDFESETVMLGKKIEHLRFGNTIYRGVIPLIKKNLNIAECIVDHVEQQEEK